MPTYNFKNTDTGEEFQEFMSMKDKEVYLQDNPHITALPSPINLHSGTGLGLRKTADGFNDLLKSKKSWYKDSNINVR